MKQPFHSGEIWDDDEYTEYDWLLFRKEWAGDDGKWWR
jgi:hypothetical protein